MGHQKSEASYIYRGAWLPQKHNIMQFLTFGAFGYNKELASCPKLIIILTQ